LHREAVNAKLKTAEDEAARLRAELMKMPR